MGQKVINIQAESRLTNTSAQESSGSIIPDPGPAPDIEPVNEERPIPGEFGDVTIGAEEVIYATDVSTYLRGGFATTITNDGVVWLDTDNRQLFFAVSDQPDITNNGTIYLSGQSQVSLNFAMSLSSRPKRKKSVKLLSI